VVRRGVGESSGSVPARGQEVRSDRRLPRVRRPRMVSHSESSLKAISRMSPPHAGHSSGNSSPTRARIFAQAIREVSCEWGFRFASPQPSVGCPPAACPPATGPRGLPMFPPASMPPNRGRGAPGVSASGAPPAAVSRSRSISARKIFVSVATARRLHTRHERHGVQKSHSPVLADQPAGPRPGVDEFSSIG